MDIKLSDLNFRSLSKLDLSSAVELFRALSGGKKIGIIAFICFVCIALLMAVLYLGGGSERKRQEVQLAFEQMSKGRAQGEVSMVAPSISTSFNDAGLNFGGAIKYFSAKNPGYTAVIENIAVQGDEALVSYKRTETLLGKSKTISVLNEKWRLEENKWVLAELSEIDRQLMKSPKGIKTKPVVQDKEPEIRQTPLTATEKAVPDRLAVAELSDPVIALKDEYSPYTSAGKRDPFKSLVVGFDRGEAASTSGLIKTCDSHRAKDFLESFDLMSVNLVGIVGAKEKFALIETPNGNGYTVKKGMHIGRNCGKIIEIRSDRMFIEEQYPDRKIGTKHVKRELKLRQDEE